MIIGLRPDTRLKPHALPELNSIFIIPGAARRHKRLTPVFPAFQSRARVPASVVPATLENYADNEQAYADYYEPFLLTVGYLIPESPRFLSFPILEKSSAGTPIAVGQNSVVRMLTCDIPEITREGVRPGSGVSLCPIP